MPRIYLSPTPSQMSHANLTSKVADAMEPLLRTNGIDYIRSRPGMTEQQAITESNSGNFDAHISLRTNSAEIPGSAHGSRQYFFESSARGHNLAEHFRKELAEIYHDRNRVTINPSTTLAELRNTRAPAVMSYLAFHDHPIDLAWIQNNIQDIALAIVRAIVAYFGMHFVAPCTSGGHHNTHFDGEFMWARVCTRGGALNIRSTPNGSIMFTVSNGASIIVTGREQNGWVPVRVNNRDGWADVTYVCGCSCDGHQRPPVAPVPPIVPVPPVTPIPPIAPIPPVMPPIAPTPPCGCPPIAPPIAPWPPVVPPIAPIPPIMPPIGVIPPVTPVPPIAPAPVPSANCGMTPSMACPARVHTQGGNLNLRRGPSMNSEIIGVISNGKRILVLAQDGNWYYTFIDGNFGWVSRDFVEMS